MARNQDDHTKNIAFLMDKSGVWRLAPAFDVNYSYNPDGAWTSRHQMSLNGKQDRFSFQDLRDAANRFQLFRGKHLDSMVDQVDQALAKWAIHAKSAGVSARRSDMLAKNFRRLGSLRSS